MGDKDALRDKIAQAAMPALHDVRVQIKGLDRDCACGVVSEVVADAVLPVVTQETAQALSLLRSRVEALADELDKEAAHTIDPETARSFPTSYVAHLGRRGGLRDAAQRLRRSLLDNKEQQP